MIFKKRENMETREYYGGTYPSQPEQKEFVVTFNIYGKASTVIFADNYEDAERIAKESKFDIKELEIDEIEIEEVDEIVEN